MIVIATHEGKDFVHQLLESWQTHGTDGHGVAVVETGGSSSEFMTYLDQISLEGWDFNLSIHRTPYKGYDTGAYLWAYGQFRDEQEFLFMHDSITVKRPGIMHDMSFVASAGSAGCVPWLVFRQNDYENDEQITHVRQFAEDPTIYPNPGCGIFGPIFYARREAIERIDPRFFETAIPSNKNEQEAMERGWAVAFDRAGIKIRSLDDDFYAHLLVHDQYPSFRKYLPRRE